MHEFILIHNRSDSVGPCLVQLAARIHTCQQVGCLTCHLGDHLASPFLYLHRRQSTGLEVHKTACDTPGLSLELVVYKTYTISRSPGFVNKIL